MRPDETLSLSCRAVGSPNPTYRWWKDGELLSSNPSHTSPTLQLSSLKPSDSGKYRCEASNTAGTVFSLSTQFQVAEMGEFELTGAQPTSIRASSGEPLLVAAPRLRSTPRAIITWSRSGQPIYPSRLGSRENPVFITQDNDLVMLSPGEEMSGGYNAEATNHVLGERRISSSIRISISPESTIRNTAMRILVPPKNLTAKSGDSSAMFECVPYSDDLSALSISWFHSSQRLSSNHNFIISDSRRLQILNPQAHLSGIYRCEVRDSRNGKVVSAEAELKVLGE